MAFIPGEGGEGGREGGREREGRREREGGKEGGKTKMDNYVAIQVTNTHNSIN